MAIETYQGITPTIDSSAYVAQQALVIGDVRIGRHSSVWPMSVVRGDVNTITIGDHTNIQDNSVLHVTHAGAENPLGNHEGFALTIGSNITVGHQCILHGCTIHDACLIGMGSLIMDGVVVESETIVGAGSLLSPNATLESGYLWYGRPARRVRKLSAKEIESLTYSAQHYVKLKNTYMV